MQAANSRPILEMNLISKAFPGVKALDKVGFRVFSGEVMALLGENGAGKSTLVKILGGVYKMDQGEIRYQNQPLRLKSPRDAIAAGIAIIHQELDLIPELTVGENIFLGREPLARSGRIDWKKLYAKAEELLKRLTIKLDLKRSVRQLSIAQQQMVEIAKALSLNARIIIMDEPTDALTTKEADTLFQIIRELKAQGKGLVYITHRINEIFEVCDRATILRDGICIGEESVEDIDEQRVIEMMVGRRLEEQIPYEPGKPSATLLEIRDLSSKKVKNINLKLAKGEVVGIAGLMGAGRTELAMTLLGVFPRQQGTVLLNGKKLRVKTPKHAIEAGIAYVSEDRKQLGLFLGLSVKDNITLPALKKFELALFKLWEKSRNRVADSYISELSIKTQGRNQLVRNLSGGNQQKVSIAKGLVTEPVLLILDEPTRGVDVGAKKEIYKLINGFKGRGLGIILISSEMPEILGISDRVVVMHNGQISGELSKQDATQEQIMRFAVGLKEKA